MKLVIISDTHGEIDKSIEVLNSLSDVDLFIHLGDYSKDAKEIQIKTGIDMINVKGNCDINDNEVSEEEIIEVKGKRIFLTHGHRYNCKWGLDNLYYRASELEVDAILFGHIHQPVNIVEGDILIFNPGSISKPRGGSKKSYGIITIDRDLNSKIIEL
ncbi:metallophosphoesterase [Clostridium sp. D2Q-11]|uniref:Phosphoesterase n=1 Tax=Anaeromonas frigoriresistens TaxID=2683708 RepID=A0A942UX76_9FIRM|nr:metallophosphoesterase [Anaeromonas frigoriresistens]MBS4538021.1 metallophosphoesterase [Anaeromonas frigoriresistens]